MSTLCEVLIKKAAGKREKTRESARKNISGDHHVNRSLVSRHSCVKHKSCTTTCQTVYCRTQRYLAKGSTMHGPAEHFIHQEQGEKWSRIWQCNGQSCANISSIVMQDLSIPLLTRPVLFHPHSLMGDTPCMWDTSSVNNTVLLVGEISVFYKYQDTCLACAHVYVGWDTVPMNVP